MCFNSVSISNILPDKRGLDSGLSEVEGRLQNPLMCTKAEWDMGHTGPVCCTYRHAQEPGLGPSGRYWIHSD